MKEDLEILVRRTLRDGKWTAPQVTVADDLPISTDRVIDRVMRERKDRPLASGEQPSESGTTNTDEDTTLGEPPTELARQEVRKPRFPYMAAVAACLLVIGGSFMLLTQNAETSVDDDVTQAAPVTTGDDPPGSASSVEPSGQEIPAAGTEPQPAETFEKCGSGPLDYDQPVHQIAFSSDGKQLATTSIRSSRNVAVWDPETGMANRFLEGSNGGVIGIVFISNNLDVAAVDSDGIGHVWDLATGSERYVIAPSDTEELFRVAYSPKEAGRELLATTNSNAEVQLWNPETGDLEQTLTGHQGTTLGVEFSPDGSLLASTSADGTVRLWDLANSGHNVLADHQAVVYDVTFNADGSKLASSAGDGETILWTAAGERLETYQSSNGTPSYSVALSPDGRNMAVGGAGVVEIWDLQSGQIVQSIPGYYQDVYEVTFNPISGQLASVGRDGRVQLHCPTG